MPEGGKSGGLLPTSAFRIRQMLPGNGEASHPRLIAGRFRLENRLGQGGFGAVYRASDELLRRPVAVKMLPVPESWQEEDYQRFLREARILASLEHPHIIRIYDAGQTEAGPFIVMQLAAGPSLSALCKNGPLAFPVVAEVLKQILDALTFAHSRGVIHRDIKPGNVLSENDGHFYLADFGLSSARDLSSIVPSGGAAGTLSYMAPECLRGEVSCASDIYSLGVLAHRILLGRERFAPSPGQQPGVTPAGFGPAAAGLPAPFAGLLTSMMAPFPSDRPTPEEALRVLRSLPVHEQAGGDLEEKTVSLGGPLFPSSQPRSAAPSSFLDLGESVFAVERLAEELESCLSSGGPLDAAFLEKFARLQDGCQKITASLGQREGDSGRPPVEDPAFTQAIVLETSRSVLDLLERLTAAFQRHTDSLSETGVAGGILALQLHRLLIPRLSRNRRDAQPATESEEFFFDEGPEQDEEARHVDDLRSGLLSPDELTRIDTLLSLSARGAEALFQVLGSAPAQDRARLLASLWSRCDILLMRMRTASRAFLESIPFLTQDPESRKKWRLLYALFKRTPSGDFWDIDAVRSTVEDLDGADRRVFSRCFLLHPHPGFRTYAIEALDPGDVWDFVLEDSTPLPRLLELWNAFGKRLPTGFRKIFFVCLKHRFASPRSPVDARAAFEFLESFYRLPFFHEDSYFRMLEQVQEELQKASSGLGVERDLDSEYSTLMKEFFAAPRSRDVPVEDWATVPLPIQRRIARKGHFLRHFVCHPVDPIALECLPHLLRLESVAPYISIFSINSRVLLELARDRRLFQWEEARFALVSNPKTPSSVVVQYISFLRRDNLKKLSESRESNQFARQFAAKLLARPG